MIENTKEFNLLKIFTHYTSISIIILVTKLSVIVFIFFVRVFKKNIK